MKEISDKLYTELLHLGIINEESQELNDVRTFNVGTSDYSSHIIQPWSIWIDWDLNPWDADIVKRVLRTKAGESRIQDYKKIIHVCKERIRQIETSIENIVNEIDFEDID